MVQSLFMEQFDIKTIATIIHVFGAVLGAGGAYLSDAMFFSSVKDEKISRTELRFLRIGSRFVWIGLLILVLSGFVLFFLDTQKYLASSKFLAKATIVLIIIINGIIFHRVHLPRIHRHAGHHFPSSDEFMRHRPLLLASGAISFLSWTTVLILGKLKSVPLSYSTIMLAYLILIIGASFTSQVLFKHKSKR